jgi:diguanylate cyclase (GGDEF)-like protein/PAS domain S-box-containing protein
MITDTTPAADSESLLDFVYQIPVAVLRMDVHGRIDLVNPRAVSLLSILGLPFRGDDGLRLLHELDADLAVRVHQEIETPDTITSQLPLVRTGLDGATYHLALTVTVVEPGSCMLTLEDRSAWKEAEEARSASDRRYRELIEIIPAGVVVHGAASEILLANAEASRLLGLSIDQLQGQNAVDPLWQFIDEEGSPMPLRDYPVNQVMATRTELRNFVLGIHHPAQDAVVWGLCNAFPQFAPSGQISEVIVSFTDITQIKRTKIELERSEERYRLMLRGSNDAPWDCDLLRQTAYNSPRWHEMLGFEASAEITDFEAWVPLIHPEDSDRVQSTLQRVLNDGTESYEIESRIRHLDGHYLDILSRGFILRDGTGKAIRVSGTNHDLSERKRAELRIHHLAFYDVLTDLPNRRLLMERLGKAIKSSGRSGLHGALLFIDLDRFKELNDSLGHNVGDDLLCQVARRFDTCVRETDTVARLGGDEFVVLLENLHLERAQSALDAERVVQKIRDTLNAVYEVGGRSYHGTSSIGITLFDGASGAVEVLLKQADLAMYQAKATGRNNFHFFDQSMQAAVDERVALESDLRNGLQRGELLLHYQLQVNRLSGMTGAEVLVRWQHPQRGLVSPAAFIPLAEATGLILPLGQWVLQCACERLAKWASDPQLRHLTLAVNVSAHQIHDPGFVEQVLAILASTGADSRRLKLELTESALAQDIESVIGRMQRLRNHGVEFALDDFGTGYSSLGYLKRLPLDQLKIDRSFVKDVLTDDSDATLARIVVTLGNELGLQVIAEGVETEEQRRFLEDNGCHDYQGYLFGRPVAIDAFERQVKAAGMGSQI